MLIYRSGLRHDSLLRTADTFRHSDDMEFPDAVAGGRIDSSMHRRRKNNLEGIRRLLNRRSVYNFDPKDPSLYPSNVLKIGSALMLFITSCKRLGLLYRLSNCAIKSRFCNDVKHRVLRSSFASILLS